MHLISRSAKETINIGKRIAKRLKHSDIICLFGELGSGKTVLAKGIAQGLGIRADRISSPSFVLIRQYLQAKIPLFHFDLYRLKNEKEILDLGYEEYFYGAGLSVIEWADRLKHLLPKEYLKIKLEVKGENKRKITLIPLGRRYRELAKLCHENIRH
jgi:tRNA threonylcarbamoyladenosine biosynthesis protein TsaE